MTTAGPLAGLRAAVVGGSLGGLCCALLLRDLGAEVDVFERTASTLVERGAGIGLLPETARYLVERAGLSVDRIGIATSRIRYLDRRGEPLYEAAHAYRFSSWNTVYRALLACFDPQRYHLGHELTGWADDGQRVVARFRDRPARDAQLLVCADGAGSTARALVLPQLRPAYAGYVAWRGTVAETALDGRTLGLLDDAITYYVYANSHILSYPIPGPDGSVERGARRINFVWYRNYDKGDDLAELLTDSSGRSHQLSLPPAAASQRHVDELRAVAAARLPAPLAAVVCGAQRPFVQVICDLETPRMVFGRACLAGDAAFVARPHAAAGSAKAAADAWALAAAIERHGFDITSALAAWEPPQLALGRQLVQRTRRIGRRSQFDGSWVPGDPELIFGLQQPGA
ncbi:MAG TPA: hypothetical protein PLB41_13225 [Rubrivivax sp.]|nr:hypothetical protein [Rubrivivax sp.]HPO17785.1 hypothetical protein [Rubrivivax sp.]